MLGQHLNRSVDESFWLKRIRWTAKRILPNDVLIGRTLVDLQNSSFPVRVANVSNSSRTIRKGTELATCEMVESVLIGMGLTAQQ